jgi:DNA recombination protein RmuC
VALGAQGAARFARADAAGLRLIELLLAATLIAACLTLGLVGILLLRERATSREAREEQARGLMTFSQTLSSQMGSIATVQNAQFETLRQAVESRLERIHHTVDEKLHATLERRLSESFRQVSERLELVHKGLGEMQTLASGVGDLKRVLSNVKTRGVMGEVQLAAILEQIMTPDQYQTNVATRPGSRERVEFAVKFPGRGGDAPHVWLPIDAKFPLEDYQRLQDAQEAGDAVRAEAAAKALEARVRLEARALAEKYLEPPATTEFALLYLPFEGLYAEVLRRPGLFEQLQRESRVTVCGPTTLTAVLNSLQMGFRTLAIEKRSSEVWKVLGEVKNEFGRFAEVLARTKLQLQSVANSIDQAEVRTRQIERRLKEVETTPLLDSASHQDRPAA